MTDIEKTRKDMRKAIRDYLYTPNPPDYNLHLNHFAGAGKSTITAQELEYTDSLFLYLTNNHSIGSEQIIHQKALFNLLQIESRKRLCRHEQFKTLSKYGINIKHFCPSCPHMGVCEYYQRIIEIWHEPQSWIGVHHHLGGLVNSYVAQNDVDVVVIDEYFTNAIYKQTKMYYSHVLNTTNLASNMRDCPEKELLFDFLHEFAYGLQKDYVNTIFLYSQVYHFFRTKGTKESLLDFADEYEMRLAEYFFQKQKIFTNIVTPIFDTVIDINNHYIPMTMPNHMEYIDNIINVVVGDKNKYIDMARYDLDALNLPCKVLILDATTPPSFYRSLFDRQVVALEKEITINSTIYQINTAKYVMRTLDKSVKSRQRLIDIVNLIAKKHQQKVLVLSRIKYEKEIKESNPEMILTDHYPLVGSNEYEKINVVVVFGTPEPRRDVLKRQSILLDYDQDELHYIMRETNIIQGIHRIRIGLKPNTPTYIYLLTSLELPFKNINRMSIGKLEKLLLDEIGGYITEENEDRIRDDLLSELSNGDKTLTRLIQSVRGNNPIVQEVLRRLIKEGMIETYKGLSIGRGRKPVYCKRADDE